jgi:putative transposase
MSDNHRVIEEPCEEKFSRTVLESGGSREGVADFNFLNLDPIPVYGHTSALDVVFSGRRIKRGLYRTSVGQLINSDVNGSYNILRKAIPNAFGNGIESCVVQPRRVNPLEVKAKGEGLEASHVM